ncbi:hypothetical protein Tco_0089571 [Tanacetum coccineum]
MKSWVFTKSSVRITFGGLLASGSVVVGPSIDQDTSCEIPIVNLENVVIDIEDDTDTIEVWNHYSEHLDAKENDICSSLIKDVGQDVPTSCPIEFFRQANKSTNVTTKPKIVQMKQKERDSGGSKLFKEYMVKQDEKQEHVIKLKSNASGATKDDPYSVSKCTSVNNRMVDGALMTDDSPLLYLAMDLFEDENTSKRILKLCGKLESGYGLKSSDKMTAIEKLGIFVYTLALEVSNRDVGFHVLARQMINPRDPTFQSTPHQIVKDKIYMSYFKRSFGILKKRWKILRGMLKYIVETQHDILIAAYALHNYIRNTDMEDKVFTTFEQHPDYMGCVELRDVHESVTNNDDISI